MLLSNTLSPSYLSDIKPEFDKGTLIRYFFLLNLTISQSRLDQFCLKTQNDQNFGNPYLLYN